MPPKPVTLRFLSDSSGIAKGFADVDSKLKSFGTKMQSVGKRLTVGLTLPLAAFGVKAVQEFSEAEQAAAQTEAAIKSTGGAAGVTAQHVADLGERIGELAAVDDELVQESANVLLTFTKIRNVGADKIFDQANLAAANLSARMKTDLSTAALQVGKALNDPIRGMTALRRVGVQFTEQQEKQIKALVESGDVMGAQKIILAELNKEFGGSAKAAGDAASPLTKLTLHMDNLGESIGAFVAPLVEKLSGFVSGLADGFKNLSPGVQDLIVKAGLVVAALGPALWIFGTITKRIDDVSNALKWLVAHPIVALIAVAALIILNWDKVSAFFKALWEKVAGFFRSVLNNVFKPIGNAIGAVAGGLMDVWEGVAAFFRGLWEKVKAIFKSARDFIVKAVDAMLGPIDELLGLLGKIPGAIGGGVSLGEAAQPIIDALNLKGAARGFSGVVSKPTMFMTGEAGPEIVDIVPLGRGRGGGGGGVINNYNYNIRVVGAPIGHINARSIVKMLNRARALAG